MSVDLVLTVSVVAIAVLAIAVRGLGVLRGHRSSSCGTAACGGCAHHGQVDQRNESAARVPDCGIV